MNTKIQSEDKPALPVSAQDLFKILEDIDIQYKNHQHAPIFTVEEGLHLKAEIEGVHCRNLFLRDKKKKMYLVVAANETAIDLKKLEKLIDSARLSFGSADRLWTHLGIRPGSVNPFCAVNDKEQHHVQIVLDKYMMDADIMNVHPMDNAMTVSIKPSDLLRFFEYTGHRPKVMDLTPAAPEPT